MRSVRNIKRDLLLFDRIGVMGLDLMVQGKGTNFGIENISDSTAADCEYLMEKGILFDLPAFRLDLAERADMLRAQTSINDDVGEREGTALLPPLPWSPQTEAHIIASAGRHPSGSLSVDQALPSGAELLVAHVERLFNPSGAVAVLDKPIQRSDWAYITNTFIISNQPEAESEFGVAEVVLLHLPIPGDHVPLDAILDFRSEPETRDRMEALRLWMARTALQGQPTNELNLELESMLHDFRRHMDIADMRAKDGILQVAISIPLHVLFEILQLRPKAAIDACFAVRAVQAERLEAELNTPGHEIAYLRSASRRFD